MEGELRASSAPPLRISPPPSPSLIVTTPPETQTCIIIEPTQQKEDIEKQLQARKTTDDGIPTVREIVLNMGGNNHNNDQVLVHEEKTPIEMQVIPDIGKIHVDMEAEETKGETENLHYDWYDNEPRNLHILSEEDTVNQLESHSAYTLEYIEDSELEEIASTSEFQRFDPVVDSMPTVQKVDNREEGIKEEASKSKENPESATNTQNPPPNI